MTLSCHHRNSTRPASLLALNDEVNDACRALALSKQVLQAREAQILRLSLTWPRTTSRWPPQ